MTKKSKSAPPPAKKAVLAKQAVPKSSAQAKAAAPQSVSAGKTPPAEQPAPVAKTTAPVATAPVATASVKNTTPAKSAPQAAPVSPTLLIDTLTTRRQESLNSAIAHLHALHSQMLHAAGRHANTALQFLNSAPKSGTLTDVIDWQSRWLLSHAHVHQDGVKALGTLATKNIEQLQKSLRVDLPRQAG